MTNPMGYPPSPMGYQSTPPMMPQRPTAVTVAAIMGIVLASISLICNGFQMIGTLAQGAIQRNAAMTTPPPQMPGWVITVQIASGVIGFAFAIAYLAASIGLLKLASWSRGAALKIAIAHIVFLIIFTGISLVVIAPVTRRVVEEQMAAQQSANSKTPAGFNTGFAAGAAYGGPVLVLIFGMILPLTMLIALKGTAARAAFEGGAYGNPYGAPPRMPPLP